MQCQFYFVLWGFGIFKSPYLCYNIHVYIEKRNG